MQSEQSSEAGIGANNLSLTVEKCLAYCLKKSRLLIVQLS